MPAVLIIPLLLLCGISVTVLAGAEDDGSTASVIPATKAGLAYGADPRQVLDLWLPPAKAPVMALPVLVYVHGGAWRLGDRRRVGAKAAWATAAGWAFASVEYRLTPQVRHPVHVQDVAAAVAWLVAHADEHGLDGRRLALLGHSAGAHLVCLLGADGERQKEAGIPPGTIRAVIGLDGAGYDIPTHMSDANPRARTIYSDAFGDDPAIWREASPISHIAAGRTYPAFLLPYVAHREASGRVAESMVLRLREAGATATALPVKDSSHALINQRFGGADDAPTAAATTLLQGVFAPATGAAMRPAP